MSDTLPKWKETETTERTQSVARVTYRELQLRVTGRETYADYSVRFFLPGRLACFHTGYVWGSAGMVEAQAAAIAAADQIVDALAT